MANKIIDTTAEEIVLNELPIKLSDEKLKNILRQVYEEAESISTRFKFYRLHKILLSIGGTMLITLLTASFKPIGTIDVKCINTIAIIITCICLLLGIIFLLIDFNITKKKDTKMREETINKIFQKHCIDK